MSHPLTDAEYAKLGHCRHPVCGDLVTRVFAESLEDRNAALLGIVTRCEAWLSTEPSGGRMQLVCQKAILENQP